MMQKWIKVYIPVLCLCLAVAGCARFNAAEPPTLTPLPPSPTLAAATLVPTAAATLAPTVTLAPTQTATPPEPTATHVPAGNVHASTNVLSLNLRSGPGTTFSIRYKAEKGAQFEVQGKAQGDNWVLVKKANGQAGWVNLDFLVLQGTLEDVPTVPVPFARVIRGKVLDSAGAPVDGIIMAVSKASDLFTNPRTEATTDASGQFFAYMPKDLSGRWYVGQVGIACTSRVATTDCRLPGSVTPRPFTLILTGAESAVIPFDYLPQ
jgi:uncharacterized protein YgiM (DUF1202 family)